VLTGLANSLKQRQGRLTTGIFGTKYVLSVLPRFGHADLAYEVVTQPSSPGWANMLNRDATTLWEHWRYSDNMFSHNHPMFGSVSEWMFNSLAGIRIADDAVGCDRIVIAPSVVGDLTWTSATYQSVRGPIESSWKITDAGLRLTVAIPVGSTAELAFPEAYSSQVTESGAPVGQVEGVEVTGNRLYRLAPGRYEFLGSHVTD